MPSLATMHDQPTVAGDEFQAGATRQRAPGQCLNIIDLAQPPRMLPLAKTIEPSGQSTKPNSVTLTGMNLGRQPHQNSAFRWLPALQYFAARQA
jgi:hypothetical protein